MSLTSSMFTGLTGLNSNQFRIDTIGNNVANMNTTGFKQSRAMFEDHFPLTLSPGSPPSTISGGTNPVQIGLGSALASVTRVHTAGTIETTGVPTDLAIEGDGFYIVSKPDNKQAFTRDGTFALNSDNELVSQDGFYVQGFGIDADYNIIPGTLTNLEIPLGSMSIASETENAQFDGNINADGAVGTQGSVLYSQQLVADAGGAQAAASTTLLTALRDVGTPATTLFSAGDTITVTGDATKGGRDIAEASFTVEAADTLDDFLTWLNGVFGLNQDTNAPGTLLDDADPTSMQGPGWFVSTGGAGEPTAGSLYVVGNHGTESALGLSATAITATSGTSTSAPLSFTEDKAADGESVYTSFVLYDSLGSSVDVSMALVMESKDDMGVTWRWRGESVDDTGSGRAPGVDGPDRLIGQGTVEFDQNGQFVRASNADVVIDRDDTGVSDPMGVTLDFLNVTCLAAGINAGAGNPTESVLVLSSQDGFPAGTLRSFGVRTDGAITGTFTNGLQRTLGQVALATFSNPEGLVAETNNTFAVGPNSGLPIITAPLTLGAGQIVSGALELSNVDLAREFIGLVTASTGFSASGRVISASDELLRELMVLVR